MVIHFASYLPAIRGPWFKKGVSVALCSAMLSVAACDMSGPKRKDLEPPPFNKRSDHTNITIEKMREISKNAPQDKKITVNSTSIVPKPVKDSRDDNNSLSGSDLATPTGLKTDNLFAAGTLDNEERFKRLENVVEGLSSDFKSLKPSIERLITIEKDLTGITYQLESLLQQEAPAARAAAMASEVEAENMMPITGTGAMPAPLYNPPVAQSNAAISSALNKTSAKPMASPIKPGNLIHTMRLADHSGKTRIVFETTEKLKYDVAVDNGENLVMITFPRGNLGSDPAKLSRYSKLIKSISQVEEGDGSLLILELHKDTQVLKQERIGPNKDNSRHRFFIDLKR